MSGFKLNSCLASQIENFINLRRLSGTDYSSQIRLLEYFDHFLVEEGYSEPGLTRQITDHYQQSLCGLSPRTRGNRLCVVRQLSKYLARNDPKSYIPESLLMPSSHKAYQPFIFSHSQVRNLLDAASKLPPPGSLRPLTYRTLFGLLYSTGLRISEAINVNLEHFLVGEQRLFIAQGKFRKARWIVLSSSTCQALQQYLDRRLQKRPNTPEAPLLLNERHRRLGYAMVNPTFKYLLKQCSIADNNRSGPRLHDLRHTFAVHRLLAWYRNGEDVNARLPSLATYMGHVNISSTQVYLRPTAELLGEVHLRFHTHYLEKVELKGERS
jgi:site-specific recombinase XerD